MGSVLFLQGQAVPGGKGAGLDRPTIAVAAPSNLAACVIDNESYGEIGMQEGQTVAGVDLAAMPAMAGWPITASAWTEDEPEARVPVILREPGPVFAAVKVTADPAPLVLPPRDGTALRTASARPCWARRHSSKSTRTISLLDPENLARVFLVSIWCYE